MKTARAALLASLSVIVSMGILVAGGFAACQDPAPAPAEPLTPVACQVEVWSGDADPAMTVGPVRLVVLPGATAVVDQLAETPPVYLRNLARAEADAGCSYYCPTQPGGCTLGCPCEPVLAEEPPGCACVRLEPTC